MERPGLTNIGMNRCGKLRWKGLQIESEWDPTIQPCNDGALWCQHTFKPIGPDGQAVDEFECNPARGCYEEL
jgi:hypothetical protein